MPFKPIYFGFLIFYRDFLTPPETMSAFAARIGAPLTVMPGGEHWFHTPEQMAFLDNWIRASSPCP